MSIKFIKYKRNIGLFFIFTAYFIDIKLKNFKFVKRIN